MTVTDKFTLQGKKFYAVLNGVVTDLTSYVLSTPAVELEWGFSGDSPVSDLIAPTGTMRLTLFNRSGLFTPDAPTTMPGWKKGVRFYMEIMYENDTYRRFAGYVQDLSYIPTRYGSNIGVVVADWFDIASRYPMDNVPIGTNKRANEITYDIMDRTYVMPAQYDFDTGINLFPLTYSTMTRKTRAYTELGKLVASEYGRIYLRKNKTDGEMLVLENMLARGGWSPLVKVRGDKAFILKAGSPTDYLLKAGSTTDRLLTPGSLISADLSDIFLEGQLDIRQGANLLNTIEFTAYPSRTDSADKTLFALQEPMLIGSGQTVVIRGNYFDSVTGQQCNGMNMITPVANVDWKAWTNSNGTGTDFSTSLQVTPVYNSDGFEHTVYNSSTNRGYITVFGVRGRGVYLENTITAKVDNAESIALNGETPASLDQKYQRTIDLGNTIARSIVEQYKDTKLDLKAIKFNANSYTLLMRVMAVIDVGDLFRIKSTLGNIDGHYYINRVKITFNPGEVYTVECLVSEKLSIMSGALTEIAAQFRGEGSKDAINFGHLPYLADLPNRTMCAWIKLIDGSVDLNADYVMGFFSDGSAFEMIATNGNGQAAGSIGFYQKYYPNGQQYWWSSGFTRNAWHHVAIYKDLSSDTSPKIYVDGALVTATLASTPVSGLTAFTDAGVPFILGNIKTATIDYAWGNSGHIQDARVYSRELTLSEIQTIYNSGNPDASIIVDINTLLFQALAVKTSSLSKYVDQPMTGLNVFENIFRAVGTVIDSPTGRSAL